MLATESVEAAAISIIDEFLSCKHNLDFLDKILGYDFPPKSAGHLCMQGRKGAGKGKGKEKEREERKM